MTFFVLSFLISGYLFWWGYFIGSRWFYGYVFQYVNALIEVEVSLSELTPIMFYMELTHSELYELKKFDKNDTLCIKNYYRW